MQIAITGSSAWRAQVGVVERDFVQGAGPKEVLSRNDTRKTIKVKRSFCTHLALWSKISPRIVDGRFIDLPDTNHGPDVFHDMFI